jgi:predicted RNase H-like HicB family nuclease
MPTNQFPGSKSQYVIDPVTEDPSSGSYRCHLAIICEYDGTYSVLVLNLPGTGSCGDTEEEAMANAREAIRRVIGTFIYRG